MNIKYCHICGHPLFEGNCYFCFEEQKFEENIAPEWLASKNARKLQRAIQALQNSKEAISFCKRRGLNYERWKLGFVPDGSKDFSEGWWNRILFPVYDCRGNIIAFGGRTLLSTKELDVLKVAGENVPKYKNSYSGEDKNGNIIYAKRKNLYLYNFLPAKSGRPICICEGYCDAITAIEHNFLAVASLGTAFTQEQALLLKSKTDKIRLCQDNDEKGELSAKKAIITLCRVGFDPDNITRMRLSENSKDIDEALRKGEHIKFIPIKDAYGDDRKLLASLYQRKEKP